MEGLRYDGQAREQVVLTHVDRTLLADRAPAGTNLFNLEGEAAEIRVVIPRAEAERKLFGFSLFAEGGDPGLPIVLRPETGSLRVGTAEAPFSVAALPEGEDMELRIFVDRYVVEVFANDRQAMLAAHLDHAGKPGFRAFTVGASTTLRRVEWWKIRPTNEGFLAARGNRVWEPVRR